MNIIELYIDGTKVDLFQDEDIRIKLQALKTEDISKSFGDFTQSFTIPASPLNNRVLKHFSDVNFVNQHEDLDLIDAELRVNGLIYRLGSVSIDGAKLKSGVPYSYSVTFYGRLSLFIDDIAGKTLRDLSLLDESKLTFNPDAIISSLASGTTNSQNAFGYPNEGIYFPPIFSDSYARVNRIELDGEGVEIPNSTSGYYNDNTSADSFVSYKDFKPSISLSKIVEAIEDEFSIELGGIADDSSHPLMDGLYMWCNSSSDSDTDYTSFHYPLKTYHATNPRISDYGVVIGNDCDAIRVNTISSDTYDLNVFINGNFALSVGKNSGGSFSPVLTRDTIDPADQIAGQTFSCNNGDIMTFRLAPRQNNNKQTITVNASDCTVDYFTIFNGINAVTNAFASFQLYSDYGSTGYDSDTTVDLAPVFDVLSIKDMIPDMKIKDFLNGICMLFNATLLPIGIDPITGNQKFDILQNDELYFTPSIDVTNYIDIDEVSVDPAVRYNEIEFKFKENQAVSNVRHLASFGEEYGSNTVTLAKGSSKLEVKIPFSTPKFIRGGYEGQYDKNIVGNLMSVAFDTDSKGASKNTTPVIFYKSTTSFTLNNGSNSGSYVAAEDCRLVVTGLDGLKTTVPSVLNTTNHKGGISLGFTPAYEQNTSAFIASDHYQEYWEDYVTTLFNDRVRKYTMSAVLPYNLVRQLKANSLVKINNTVYTIDSADISLKDGKTTLVLINNGYLYL